MTKKNNFKCSHFWLQYSCSDKRTKAHENKEKLKTEMVREDRKEDNKLI